MNGIAKPYKILVALAICLTETIGEILLIISLTFPSQNFSVIKGEVDEIPTLSKAKFNSSGRENHQS